jgi:hypothetical protein
MEGNMANDDARNVDRAWELMKKIGFAMLVTRDGDKLRARPMSAYFEREENATSRIEGRTHVSTRSHAAPSNKILLASRGASTHVAGGGEQGVDAVAVAALEMVTAHSVVVLEMADHRTFPRGGDKILRNFTGMRRLAAAVRRFWLTLG